MDIRGMEDKQVYEMYDKVVGTENKAFWLTEISRRIMQRQSDQMLAVTLKIKTVTFIMMWAAIVSTVAAIISLIVALQSICH